MAIVDRRYLRQRGECHHSVVNSLSFRRASRAALWPVFWECYVANFPSAFRRLRSGSSCIGGGCAEVLPAPK